MKHGSSASIISISTLLIASMYSLYREALERYGAPLLVLVRVRSPVLFPVDSLLAVEVACVVPLALLLFLLALFPVPLAFVLPVEALFSLLFSSIT